MGEMCRPFDLGTSNDLDLWLLLAAAEYGLATRDTPFFDEQLRWRDGGSATLWEHLEARLHPPGEPARPARRLPDAGTNGDWSDFSTTILGMTESMLVTAQLAYVYPRLAELADLRGDQGFAARLRAAAAQDRAALSGEWTGRGWYSRGYAGDRSARAPGRSSASRSRGRCSPASRTPQPGTDAGRQHPPLPDRDRGAARHGPARSAPRSRRPATTPT